LGILAQRRQGHESTHEPQRQDVGAHSGLARRGARRTGTHEVQQPEKDQHQSAAQKPHACTVITAAENGCHTDMDNAEQQDEHGDKAVDSLHHFDPSPGDLIGPYNRGVKRHLEKDDIGGTKDKASASDADAEYLARAMADVVRLAPDPRSRVRPPPAISTPRARASSTSSSSKPGNGDSSDAAFVAQGVDRRELRRLKRGEHSPGSRLDLHGMTSAEAIVRLKRFIDEASHRHRCVCIVHGRGLHSEGNVSVLKTRVREWLRQHSAVLAYADARRTDGGTGAVYVLLRK
jgi:DNA-nicking Smr family endonuclease